MKIASLSFALNTILKSYLKRLTETFRRGDAREESYYTHLEDLIRQLSEYQQRENIYITTLPKKTKAGNPDFRIWDGRNHITGYIEAKDPSVTNLNHVEETEQLQRYLKTFPNVILTNFYEFRLYRNGERLHQVMIARPKVALSLKTAPPLENKKLFMALWDAFFSFSQPEIRSAKALAVELAKLF